MLNYLIKLPRLAKQLILFITNALCEISSSLSLDFYTIMQYNVTSLLENELKYESE